MLEKRAGRVSSLDVLTESALELRRIFTFLLLGSSEDLLEPLVQGGEVNPGQLVGFISPLGDDKRQLQRRDE